MFCFLLTGFAAVPAARAAASAPIVGQIDALGGGVLLRPPGGSWSEAEINEPVAGAAALRTATAGRVAVRIGADRVALAADSEVEFGQLDAARGLHLLLHQGRIGIALSAADPALTIAVDTPLGQVWLQTAGDYAISVGDATTPGRLAVFAGRARVIARGIDRTIAAGRAIALAAGTAEEAAAADDFVRWWRPSPLATTAASPSLADLSPDMTGYTALDDAGIWQTGADGRAIWFPRNLPDGWAPYRFGHWRWLPPWGWTWIDAMSWGFAPSHYGRWARFPAPGGGERWGWVPGTRVDDPQFMPAAVAFVGTAGVGISYPDAHGPAVGWFPLAPGEIFWPSYTTDLAAIRRLNRGAAADLAALEPATDRKPPASVIDAAYRNREFASVVPRAVFVGGKPVAPALIRLPAERLKNAPLLAGSPDIAPAVKPLAPPSARPALAAAGGRSGKAAAQQARRLRAAQRLARIVRSRRHAIRVGWRAHHLHAQRLQVLRAAFRRGGHHRLHVLAFHRR